MGDEYVQTDGWGNVYSYIPEPMKTPVTKESALLEQLMLKQQEMSRLQREVAHLHKGLAYVHSGLRDLDREGARAVAIRVGYLRDAIEDISSTVIE